MRVFESNVMQSSIYTGIESKATIHLTRLVVEGYLSRLETNGLDGRTTDMMPC